MGNLNENICEKCEKKHRINDPIFELFATLMAEEYFSGLWKEGKPDIKMMSKKEVAKQMYFLGALHLMENMTHIKENFVDELKASLKRIDEKNF